MIKEGFSFAAVSKRKIRSEKESRLINQNSCFRSGGMELFQKAMPVHLSKVFLLP
jgi:hypothetical protein